MSTQIPPVARTGRRPSNLPWHLMNDMLGEDAGAFGVGGLVFVATAAAALNIGDAVYLSAAFTVNKSTVAANGLLRCGIVVGGAPRSVTDGTLEVLQRIDAIVSPYGDVGQQAAATNDRVLVCFAGICYAIADGAITAGAQIKPSVTTAGRVTAASATAIAAGATAVTSVAANGASDITGDGTSPIFGQAFDAATGAADIFRVLLGI